MVRDCTLAGGRAQNRRGHRQMHIAKHALVFAGGFLPVPLVKRITFFIYCFCIPEFMEFDLH
jgi:hypothetical protein